MSVSNSTANSSTGSRSSTIGWVCLAVFVTVVLCALAWKPSGPKMPPIGRYQIAGAGPAVWRVDTSTGVVSWCRGGSVEQEPVCSEWGFKTPELLKIDQEVGRMEQEVNRQLQQDGAAGAGQK